MLPFFLSFFPSFIHSPFPPSFTPSEKGCINHSATMTALMGFEPHLFNVSLLTLSAVPPMSFTPGLNIVFLTFCHYPPGSLSPCIDFLSRKNCIYSSLLSLAFPTQSVPQRITAHIVDQIYLLSATSRSNLPHQSFRPYHSYRAGTG